MQNDRSHALSCCVYYYVICACVQVFLVMIHQSALGVLGVVRKQAEVLRVARIRSKLALGVVAKFGYRQQLISIQKRY